MTAVRRVLAAAGRRAASTLVRRVLPASSTPTALSRRLSTLPEKGTPMEEDLHRQILKLKNDCVDMTENSVTLLTELETDVAEVSETFV